MKTHEINKRCSEPRKHSQELAMNIDENHHYSFVFVLFYSFHLSVKSLYCIFSKQNGKHGSKGNSLFADEKKKKKKPSNEHERDFNFKNDVFYKRKQDEAVKFNIRE